MSWRTGIIVTRFLALRALKSTARRTAVTPEPTGYATDWLRLTPSPTPDSVSKYPLFLRLALEGGAKVFHLLDLAPESSCQRSYGPIAAGCGMNGWLIRLCQKERK